MMGDPDDVGSIGVVRPIVRWGDAVLHKPCAPIVYFDDGLAQLIADLFATNRAANGAGLAAPQIGVGKAVFVYECTDEFGQWQAGAICNPQVSIPPEHEQTVVDWEEGCLSFPGANAWLTRPEFATCVGQGQLGQQVEVTAGGTLGRCLQHETDHLGGIVFGDRLRERDRQRLYQRARQPATLYPSDWPVSAVLSE